MSKIDDLIARLCPNGVEFKPIGELLSLEYGKPLKENHRTGDDFPVLGSNGRVGFHNSYLVNGPCLIIGRKGSAGALVWEENNCYPIDTTFYVKIKEEKLKEENDNHDIIQIHQDNLSLCNRKLETLLSMRLNNELDGDDYVRRKNELMEEKLQLKEFLEDTQTRIDTWIARAEELFIFAKTAKTRFENGTHEEKRRILQALGSNLFLADRTLCIELNEPLSLIKAYVPEAKSII